MATQLDRFDVVVVGARGSGSSASVSLAAAIERRFGIPQAAVQLGLEHGGIEVHREVAKAEAITLARALQELGAVVDVRAARSEPSSPFLLEPDAEASASPPAPPPFSPGGGDDDRDYVSLDELDAEPPRAPPRSVRSPTDAIDDSRPHGPPSHVEPERPFDGKPPRRASQSGVGTARPTTSRTPTRPDPSPVIPARPDSSRARSDPSPAKSRTPTRPDPSPASTGGVRRNTTEVVATDDFGPLDPGAETIDAAALGGVSPPTRFAPPELGERVELDLAAAGLSAPPAGASVLARRRGGSESSGARPIAESSGARPAESTSTRAAASSAAFPVPMEPPSASTRMPTMVPPGSGLYEHGPIASAHVAVSVGLLATDRVLSGLLGATLAAVVGIVVAYGWVRRDTIVTAEKLETELRDAIADPIGVDDGRVRAPQAITDELTEALDDRRMRYLLIWALVALPLGLGLGLVKRDRPLASSLPADRPPP